MWLMGWSFCRSFDKRKGRLVCSIRPFFLIVNDVYYLYPFLCFSPR